MDFNEDEKRLMFRRCNSEPPLGGRLTSSSRQSSSSAYSLQEIKTLQQKRHSCQRPNGPGGNGPVVRSSTFPLLPTFGNKASKTNQTFLKSVEKDPHNEHLPFFSNFAFNNREITPNQRGIHAKKFHLRSRYAIDAMKGPSKKELPSNPLRKRVQEINDTDKNDEVKTTILPESDDLSSNFPFTGQQMSIRRLSVITEKSNFSRTSTMKTAFFDLEDENDIKKSILPSVEKNQLKKKPSYLEKNSLKLQEHVQMTEKQFNPLETKANLLNSWFKSLETEG